MYSCFLSGGRESGGLGRLRVSRGEVGSDVSLQGGGGGIILVKARTKYNVVLYIYIVQCGHLMYCPVSLYEY